MGLPLNNMQGAAGDSLLVEKPSSNFSYNMPPLLSASLMQPIENQYTLPPLAIASLMGTPERSSGLMPMARASFGLPMRGTGFQKRN